MTGAAFYCVADERYFLGAAAMVTDELFAPAELARWIDAGTPRTTGLASAVPSSPHR